MKKCFSLQLFLIFAVAIFASFIGNVAILPVQSNTYQSSLSTNIAQSTPLVASPNENLTSDVIFFCFNSESPDVSLLASRLDGTNGTSLAQVAKDYISTISNQTIAFDINIVKDVTNNPILLKIPTSAINSSGSMSSYDNLFNNLLTQLSQQTLSSPLNNTGDKLTFIYLNYKDYSAISDSTAAYNEFLNRVSNSNNGLFWPHYTYTYNQTTGAPVAKNFTYNTTSGTQNGSIDEYILMHSDSFTFMETTSNHYSQYAKSIYCHELMHMFGMPDNYYTSTVGNQTKTYSNYSGVWDIMSDGSYHTTPHPFYLYEKGWYPNASSNVIELSKQGTYEIDTNGNTMYYIKSEEYENQYIVIYYQDVSTLSLIDSNFVGAQSGVLISRVNTTKKHSETLYQSATSTYAPVYYFTPESTSVVSRSERDKLLNATLQPGESIGLPNIEEASDSAYTGFISFYNSSTGKYENSTLKIDVAQGTSNNKLNITITCKKDHVLAPSSGPEYKKISSLEHLNTDIKLELYNMYVNFHMDTLVSKYGLSENSIRYTYIDGTPEYNWERFCTIVPDRLDIFNNEIYTTDQAFRSCELLDISHCNGVDNIEFLKDIWFENLKELCLTGCDLSNTSLENLSTLSKLEVLEMNSCKLQDISPLTNLADMITHISMMQNNIEDFSVLRQFTTLSYANIMLNNAEFDILNTATGTTTSIYSNPVIDIGLQKIPTNKFITTQSSFIFKDAVQLSNINTVFTQILLHTSGQVEPTNSNEPMAIQSLQHGKYVLSPISYDSLITNGGIRYLESYEFNCYFMQFTHAVEEVCQTMLNFNGERESLVYDFSLNAYDSLNPLLNYNTSDFYPFTVSLEKLNTQSGLYEKVTPPEGFDVTLNIKDAGTYKIIYTFPFANGVQESLGAPETYLEIYKTVYVRPYDIIGFDPFYNPAPNTIHDATLYKALLLLTGKITSTAEITTDEVLGTGNFILYSQDLYFYGIENKQIPTIPENLGKLSELDITSFVAKVSKDSTVYDIGGIEHFNMQAVEVITLNSLDISDITVLFNNGILPKIRVLNAADNQISKITGIHVLDTLEYIDLSFNLITDPSDLYHLTNIATLKAKGLKTQTLKLVNLSFNQITIYGNNRANNQNEYPYNHGNVANEFMLSTATEGSFKSNNEIYIILIQLLNNYDNYANSSKWEYYHTSAVNYTTTAKLYTVKIGGATANFERASDKHTDYTTTRGTYTVTCELKDRTNIPFKSIKTSLTYTVTRVSLSTLEEILGIYYPDNPTLEEKNTTTGNFLVYNFLSTEYDKIIAQLEAAGRTFEPRSNDIAVDFTNTSYNFYDETQLDSNGVREPVIISKALTQYPSDIRFRYEVGLYKCNPLVSNIDLDKIISQQLSDKQIFQIQIMITDNNALKFDDDNLKKALLREKGDNSTEIYMYDFYNYTELDLSNAGITTFSSPVDELGFNNLIFTSLQRIDLSHNQLTNNPSIGDIIYPSLADPMAWLLINNSALLHLTYLDLSYNNLIYLGPLQETLFEKTMTINLFANAIDFEDNRNKNIVQAQSFLVQNCKVIIGIQGLNETTEKMVSYNKEVLSSKDTFAKFFLYSGNIQFDTLDYSFNGANLEYIYNNKNEQLCSLYFYKEAKDYTVSFNASYAGLDFVFNCIIKHQKLYIDVYEDENGNLIENNNVYIEFDSKNSQETIDEYLAYDFFTYENCTRDDFGMIANTIRTVQSESAVIRIDELTAQDNPYMQLYLIEHTASKMTENDFLKKLHVVDTTAPVIFMTQDDSVVRHVITKGNNYPYFNADHIDSDLSYSDDFNNFFDIQVLVTVTITKDNILISQTTGNWGETFEGFSINTNLTGIYRVEYTATDYSGNVSEPFVREIEVYYQPYAWIRISNSVSMFSAGETTVSASVYRSTEDVNKNHNPVFYWYVDGVFVKTSTVDHSLGSETNLNTETTLYIEGAGTHLIEVYIDQTKESFELNNVDAMFASNYKTTSAFILMDDNVMKITIIVVAVLLILLIILIIIIKKTKQRRELQRNTYSYTIEKNNKRRSK